MNAPAASVRPSLKEALDAWKKALAGHGFSTNLLWIFEENLCFKKSRAAKGGYRFGFQTIFTPPPEDALEIAYDSFSATPARLVLYRLGECRGRSICILLCDPWFEMKGEAEGFVRHDEWAISFHPGQADKIEEVADLAHWLHRVKRRHAFHDLDFCMALETIDEIKTYGRPLVHYERFAQTMISRLRRFLGQPA